MLFSNRWVKPSLREEWDEIVRTAKEFDLDPSELRKAYRKGRMIVLDDSLWSRMENTDSWNIEPGDWDAVKDLTEKYQRDPIPIATALKEGLPLPSPLVLSTNGTDYLIAGNTRLMVSRAMGVRPEIFLLTVGE
jgi:hypothetical protein